MICIAYGNETSDACRNLSIDPFEVCRASATKPFGYQPFAPGLGIGGHCIPVNPYYLFSTSDSPLLKATTEAMDNQPAHITEEALNSLLSKKCRRDSGVDFNHRVLVAGMGFKGGQCLLANSPGLTVAQELKRVGVGIMLAKPLVLQTNVPDKDRRSDTD